MARATEAQRKQFAEAMKRVHLGLSILGNELSLTKRHPDLTGLLFLSGTQRAQLHRHLFGLKCYTNDPGDRRSHREERQRILDFFQSIGRSAIVQDPRSPTVSSITPGEVQRAVEYTQFIRSRADDLKWMAANPIGAGTYGIERSLRGSDHIRAMKRARNVQATFDLLDAGSGLVPAR